MKSFFVVVLMTGSSLRVYSNYFAAYGEEPTPTFGSFSFGALDDCLVVGFLSEIVPATKINFQRLCKTKLDKTINCSHVKFTELDTYL
jgi:hypothetical protein